MEPFKFLIDGTKQDGTKKSCEIWGNEIEIVAELAALMEMQVGVRRILKLAVMAYEMQHGEVTKEKMYKQ